MLHRTIALDGLKTEEGLVDKLDLYLASVIVAGLAHVLPRGAYPPHTTLIGSILFWHRLSVI